MISFLSVLLNIIVQFVLLAYSRGKLLFCLCVYHNIILITFCIFIKIGKSIIRCIYKYKDIYKYKEGDKIKHTSRKHSVTKWTLGLTYLKNTLHPLLARLDIWSLISRSNLSKKDTSHTPREDIWSLISCYEIDIRLNSSQKLTYELKDAQDHISKSFTHTLN